MGLFVVGRLALRHGIRVQLRQQDRGGLTAMVLLPDEVLAGHGAPSGGDRAVMADATGPLPMFGLQEPPPGFGTMQPPSRNGTWLDRQVEGLLARLIRFYDRTLTLALGHRSFMLIVFVATIVLTVGLYIKTPKGYFPQDDTGLVFGGTIASPDISFDAMKALQLKAAFSNMLDQMQ